MRSGSARTNSSSQATARRNCWKRAKPSHIWARLSYGFMGRTPDYKAAFMASMAANPEFYAPFDSSATAWYRNYSSQCLFLNHVLINPPVDRNRPVHEVEDVFVHVVKERDDGIVVSGRQDAGHRFCAYPCNLRGPKQRRHSGQGQGQGFRHRLHRADGFARRQAYLQAVV